MENLKFYFCSDEDIMSTEEIKQWPTFIAYKNGNQVERLEWDEIPRLEAFVNKYADENNNVTSKNKKQAIPSGTCGII